MKRCVRCNQTKQSTEFYVKDRRSGRTSNKCKDCEIIDRAKRRGIEIKEVGKVRKARLLLNDGLRKCCDCKTVKPLTSFIKNRSVKGGINHVCYDCSHKRVKKYVSDNRENIGKHYLNRYIIENYGAKKENITPELIEIARLQIQAKRSLKYTLNGKEFKTLEEFAKYIFKTYGVPETCTKKRIDNGYSEQDCTMSITDFRSKNNHKSKGMVKVTDLSSGSVTVYTSPARARKAMHVSSEVIERCLTAGEIREPYNNSVNRSRLKFEYYG